MKSYSPAIENVTKDQAIKGLHISCISRICIVLFSGFLIFLNMNSSTETVIKFLIFLVIFSVSIIMVLKTIKADKYPFPEYTGSILDIIIIFFILFIFITPSTNLDNTSVLVISGVLSPLCMLMIFMNALSAKSKYVVLMGGFSVAVHVAAIIPISAGLTDIPVSSFHITDPLNPYIILFLMLHLSLIIMFTFLAVFMKKILSRTTDRIAEAGSIVTQMNRYFSESVILGLYSKADKIYKESGETENSAVFCADMRDFNMISETYDPKKFFFIISGFQKILRESVFRNSGSVIKIQNGEILAVFGIPNQSENDILNAVNAGWEVLTEIEEFNESLFKKGLIPVKISIGIHSGPVMIGNTGNSEFLEYTVAGNTVNYAEKIKTACKISGKPFLISEELSELSKKFFTCIPAGKIALKGKKNSTQLFNVISRTDEWETFKK